MSPDTPTNETFTLETIEADDDVFIVLNLSAATTFMVMFEEAVKAARRKKADRLFLKALKSKVFGDE